MHPNMGNAFVAKLQSGVQKTCQDILYPYGPILTQIIDKVYDLSLKEPWLLKPGTIEGHVTVVESHFWAHWPGYQDGYVICIPIGWTTTRTGTGTGSDTWILIGSLRQYIRAPTNHIWVLSLALAPAPAPVWPTALYNLDHLDHSDSQSVILE